MGTVLFVVTADLPRGAAAPPSKGGPQRDYAAIAAALDADVLDRTAVRRSWWGRVIARCAGIAVAQAVVAWTQRSRVDAFLTDGEHIGLPLALLLKLSRARAAHVTIGHRISAPKKRFFWKHLRAWTHIHRILLHATPQRRIAIETLGVPPDRLALVPYQVDTEFWDPRAVIDSPEAAPDEQLVVSAGLELRDYPTLFDAVTGSNARVVVAAASNWSKRRNSALDSPRPENVTVTSLDYQGLRALYARAALVVVPVVETDFQAGITTILEAMAMAKPVIVTRTAGQTDVVVDGEASPDSFLRAYAAEAGVPLSATGVYVPVGDAAALRAAIDELLSDPEKRRRLGAAGRDTVKHLMRVDHFAERVSEHVRQVVRLPAPTTAPALVAA